MAKGGGRQESVEIRRSENVSAREKVGGEVALWCWYYRTRVCDIGRRVACPGGGGSFARLTCLL
jgi:hypothetical protein